MKILSFILLAFCILIFIVSCNSKQKTLAFDENLIHVISENPIYSGHSEMPPSYAFSIFFVQGDSGKIIELDPRELEEIYNEDYSSWKYKEFVRKALNQRLIIKNKVKGQPFELNKDVMGNYLNHSFVDFISIYCEARGKEKYVLNLDVPENQMSTIFYYAFINNYLTVFDDALGRDYISSTSIYLDQKKKED